MALLLAPARNEREAAILAVIGELETALPLGLGSAYGPWVVRLLERLTLGFADRGVLTCATVWILRAQPQPRRDVQWAVLSAVACFDPAQLNLRTRTYMPMVLDLLAALHRQSETPTGLAPNQFKLIANELVRQALRPVPPALRLTVEDLTLYRRCYHLLRQRLFGG